MTREQFISSAIVLPPADRRLIALALWPRIKDEILPSEPLSESEAFWAEMDGRVAGYKADPSRLLNREQFDAAVAARMAAGRTDPAP